MTSLPSHMSIPAEVTATVEPNGSTHTHHIERSLRELPGIKACLDAAGFNSGDTAVDYGCGIGVWTWALSGRYNNVIGIDLNKQFLETSRKISNANDLNNIEYRNADSLLSLKDRSIDVLLSIGTLHNVGTGDYWHDFFLNARRTLKPNGRILINVASPLFPLQYALKLESLKFIKRGGLMVAADRQLGWMLAFVRSAFAVERGRRCYAVSRRGVEQFAAGYGFDIDPNIDQIRASLSATPIEQYQPELLPMYNWFLFRNTRSSVA